MKRLLFELKSISSLSSVIVWVRVVHKRLLFSKWCELRSINSLSSVIVWVRVVFKRTSSAEISRRQGSFYSVFITGIPEEYRKNYKVEFTGVTSLVFGRIISQEGSLIMCVDNQ